MALWGGRFSEGPQNSVFALSRSVHFDWRLAPYDIRSSKAHLAVLKKNKLIEDNDAKMILNALSELANEVASGVFAPIDSDEDVHSALERGLTQKLGAVGGSLRAGRSRNDQVTTDLRLFSHQALLIFNMHNRFLLVMNLQSTHRHLHAIWIELMIGCRELQ